MYSLYHVFHVWCRVQCGVVVRRGPVPSPACGWPNIWSSMSDTVGIRGLGAMMWYQEFRGYDEGSGV